MTPLNTSLIVFVCVFGGALLGIFLQRRLPDQHLSADSKDVVRLGMGLVATTLALVLGLLVASAKGFYDTQSEEITRAAADIVLLDRLLAHYGPDAAEARATLRASVARHMELMWPGDRSNKSDLTSNSEKLEAVFISLHALSPKDDTQRSLKAQTMNLAAELGHTRWLIFEQQTVTVPKLLLVMLLFWLVVLFVSFGLFAPPNLTVVASLFFSAVAVSGAIFLILEMYHPYSGLIQVSDAPIRAALAQLGR